MVEGATIDTSRVWSIYVATLSAIGLHPALTLKCFEPDIINFAAWESLRLTGFIFIGLPNLNYVVLTCTHKMN